MFAQISLVHQILVGSRGLWIWLVRVLAPTLWLYYYLIFSVFNCKELVILIDISHAALTIILQVFRWVFDETVFAIRILERISHMRIVGVLLKSYQCWKHTNARLYHKGAIHACTRTLAAQVLDTRIQMPQNFGFLELSKLSSSRLAFLIKDAAFLSSYFQSRQDSLRGLASLHRAINLFLTLHLFALLE